MALTEIYVDPSIAGDSGTGTIGDPFGDLEYAIEQTTFDTTNGTRVNILAGTDEVLAAELSAAMADTVTTVAWAPSATAPCIFQGYTAAAGDGGIGGISGGGSVSVYNDAALDFIYFIDLHLHNCGANPVISGDDFIGVINCEVDNSTSNGIDVDADALIYNTYVHNVGGIGVNIVSGLVEQCRIEDGTNTLSKGIFMSGTQGAIAHRNIVKVSGAANGIEGRLRCSAMHNSIYSDGGTGSGIEWSGAGFGFVVANNLVEGFSGTGGIGIEFVSSMDAVIIYGANSVYDCATAFSASAPVATNIGGNETLTVSPFTAAATSDFSPVDTGSVKEGHLPESFRS